MCYIFGEEQQKGAISTERLLDLSQHIRITEVLELGGGKGGHAFVNARPFHSLSFRKRGCGVIREGRREFPLTDGLLLYIPAGTAYELCCGTEWLSVVHFELSRPVKVGISSLTVSDAPLLEEILSSMHELWCSREVGFEALELSLFYRLLALIEAATERREPQEERARIRAALEHIHRHFRDPSLEIATLCQLTGLGETQFRRYFCRVCGKTPLRYINECRVSYAASLLDSGFSPLREVAFACGFSDPKYFSTVFKKHKGLSPSAYRSKVAEEGGNSCRDGVNFRNSTCQGAPTVLY